MCTNRTQFPNFRWFLCVYKRYSLPRYQVKMYMIGTKTSILLIPFIQETGSEFQKIVSAEISLCVAFSADRIEWKIFVE